jgi:hypothetical protein
VLLILLLTSSFYMDLQNSQAQDQTLAQVINNVTGNIQTVNSSWNTIYDQIFCKQNTTVYDNSILDVLNNSDYDSVVFIARLAELNGYNSQAINDSLVTALQKIPLDGGLPANFSLYDRYLINGYRYAQELNVTGWNITQAYSDFTSKYQSFGATAFTNSAYSRYYDEDAEALSAFLEFANNGIDLLALQSANQAWDNTQSLWNGTYYVYRPENMGGYHVNSVECEMGNFAQAVTQYANSQGGNIEYFDRVVSDLQNKLLVSGFDSPGWGTTGVLRHATDNPQLRLEETTGAIIALQMLSPYFSPDMQANFRGMLQTTAWQGLVASSLYKEGQFSFFDNTTDAEQPCFCDDASSVGAMTLFLEGIIPNTGYLAINASNEAYQDYRTCFPTAQWQFNYQTHTIRVPIMAGSLSFIFGSQPVSANFDSNGVFDITFSADWNTITSLNKVTDISMTSLPHATPQPDTTATATPKPSPTPTPTTQTPQTTPTPTPNQNTTQTTTPPTNPPPTSKINQTSAILIAVGISGLLVLAVFCYVYLKRKKRRPN